MEELDEVETCGEVIAGDDGGAGGGVDGVAAPDLLALQIEDGDREFGPSTLVPTDRKGFVGGVGPDLEGGGGFRSGFRTADQGDAEFGMVCEVGLVAGGEEHGPVGHLILELEHDAVVGCGIGDHGLGHAQDVDVGIILCGEAGGGEGDLVGGAGSGLGVPSHCALCPWAEGRAKPRGVNATVSCIGRSRIVIQGKRGVVQGGGAWNHGEVKLKKPAQGDRRPTDCPTGG